MRGAPASQNPIKLIFMKEFRNERFRSVIELEDRKLQNPGMKFALPVM